MIFALFEDILECDVTDDREVFLFCFKLFDDLRYVVPLWGVD